MEKNKGYISKWDAYRIYNGHSFRQSVIRSVLISAGIVLAVSAAIGLILMGTGEDFWKTFVESVIITWYIVLWLIILLKRVSSADMGDKDAPGGKYLRTVKGGADTYAKAHRLTTAECVIMTAIFFIPNTIMYIYDVFCVIGYYRYYEQHGTEYTISFAAEDIADSFGIYTITYLFEVMVLLWCIMLPVALSNLVEIYGRSTHRSALVTGVFVLCPFLLVKLWMNHYELDTLFWSISSVVIVALLIVTERAVIKRKTADMAHDERGESIEGA